MWGDAARHNCKIRIGNTVGSSNFRPRQTQPGTAIETDDARHFPRMRHPPCLTGEPVGFLARFRRPALRPPGSIRRKSSHVTSCPRAYESAVLADAQIINPLGIDPGADYWKSWLRIGASAAGCRRSD